MDSSVISFGAVILGGVISGVTVSWTITVLVTCMASFPELSAQSYLTWYDCAYVVSTVELSTSGEIVPSILSEHTAPSSV